MSNCARVGAGRLVMAHRSGLLVLVAVAMATDPARAQTDSPVPDVTVEGGQAPAAPPAVPPAPSPPAEATAPSLKPPPSLPSAPSPADTALERVLRSGCREGLDELRALRGDPTAPWADTVARLCGNVLREPVPVVIKPPGTMSETASANEGRGRLALWSSLYGIWFGFAGDVLLGVNDIHPAVLLPMLGVGAGLGASLGLTADHPVTTGEAWTIITGLDYASVHGGLWGAGLGLSNKGVVGTALLGGVTALPVAIYVASTQSPKAGDIELVRSSLLWGTTAGLLGVAALAPNTSSEGTWRVGAIAMDVGLVAGISLANNFDLSRNRVLIIDAGAVGGGLVGFGVALFISSNPDISGRKVAGGALGGLVAGIALAALATRNLDRHETQASAPAYPALLARGADGHWTLGMPAPTPVLDGRGTRPVGASLAAMGGLF